MPKLRIPPLRQGQVDVLLGQIFNLSILIDP